MRLLMWGVRIIIWGECVFGGSCLEFGVLGVLCMSGFLEISRFFFVCFNGVGKVLFEKFGVVGVLGVCVGVG